MLLKERRIYPGYYLDNERNVRMMNDKIFKDINLDFERVVDYLNGAFHEFKIVKI